MKIKVDEIGKDVGSAWIEYDDGWELELDFVSAKDQREGLRGKRGKDPTDAQIRKFWCGHVLDWRGLDGDDGAITCTSDEGKRFLRSLWDGPIAFSNWLVEEATELSSFQSQPEPAPAGDASSD